MSLETDRKYSLVNLEEYTALTLQKSEYHKKQAAISLSWHNLLGITNLLIASGQALTMTLQTVYGSDSKDIAVSGGIFAFFGAVFNRIQMSFSFNVISVLHNQVSDDFMEIHSKFKNFNMENDEYYKLVDRYVSITEKSHIQTTRDYWFLAYCR